MCGTHLGRAWWGGPAALEAGWPAARDGMRERARERSKRALVSLNLVPFVSPSQADFGDALLAVAAPAWDPSTAPALTWSEGDVWSGTLAAPAGSGPVEFKLVVARADGGFEWEAGPNRSLAVPETAGAVVIAEAAWGAPEETTVVVSEAAALEDAAAAVVVSEAAKEEEEVEPPAAVAAAVAVKEVVEAPPAPALEATAVPMPAAAAVAAPVVVEEGATEEVEEAPPSSPLPSTPLAQTVLNLAMGATATVATVGLTAVLASALAVDVGEVAAVSALAAAGAAAVGSRDPETAAKLKSAAKASASAVGGFADGAEGLLRAAGLKSFKEQAEDEKKKQEE